MTKALAKVAKLNGGRAPSSPLSSSSALEPGSSSAPGSQSSTPRQTPFTLLSLISRCLLLDVRPCQCALHYPCPMSNNVDLTNQNQKAFDHSFHLQPRPCNDDHGALPQLARRRLLLLRTLSSLRSDILSSLTARLALRFIF